MDINSHIKTSANAEKVKEFLNNIDYRVARTNEELEKAYALVYKEYLKKKYINPSQSELKISIYNAIPDTTTFIGIASSDIIATATIIPDSELGLPMDRIYNNELNDFRKNKAKICEISMLASNTDLFEGGVSLMLNTKKLFFIFSLFKLIFDYSREVMKFDLLCITINPKHKLTYDFLLFKDFGGLKTYNSVNGAPAIAKYLDLQNAEKDCKDSNKIGLYKMFLSKNTDHEKFSRKCTFTLQDLKHFFMDKSDVLKTAQPHELNYIKKCYPCYDFSQIIS